MLGEFFDGATDFLATTDANHNMKNLRNQLIGGAGFTHIGDWPIEGTLLQLAGVHHELFRIKDYASDLLVCSYVHSTTSSNA